MANKLGSFLEKEPTRKMVSEPINVEGEFTPPNIDQLIEGVARDRNEADDQQERIASDRTALGGLGGELAILLGSIAGAGIGGGGITEAADVARRDIGALQERKREDAKYQDKLALHLAKTRGADTSKLDAAKFKADTKAQRDLIVDTDKLRKEIGGSKDIKDHQVIEANYQNIDNLIQKGKFGSFTKADDISLIFSFMKMLDPASVVREGEQATVANSGTIPETIRALYNKTLVSGEILPPQVRWDYIKQSNALVNTKRKDIRRKLSKYKGLAERRGMPVEDLILGRFGIEGEAEIPEYVEQNGWIYDKRTGKVIKKAGR